MSVSEGIMLRSTSWPQNHEELLRSLYGEGLSCSIIANKINETFRTTYSRNAIIGKIDRIRLPKRERKAPAKRLTARVRSPRKPWKPVRLVAKQPRSSMRKLHLSSGHNRPSYSPAIDDVTIPIEQRKTFMELGDNDCRWPVCENGSPDFFFCGGVALKDQPYCAGHCARAFDLSYRNVTRKRPVSIQSKAWGSYVAG